MKSKMKQFLFVCISLLMFSACKETSPGDLFGRGVAVCDG